MKKHLTTAFLCFFISFANILTAQKTIVEDEQTWVGMFNQVRFSKQWGLWDDIHFRLKDNFIKEPSQFLIRFGPTYYLNDDVRLTAAYSFAHTFPDETHKNISQPEHRPFQQVQWYTRYGKTRLMQWIRLEERFRRKIKNDDELADGYNFNWRARYNFGLFLPLSKKGLVPHTLQFLLNDELMVNFGKNIVYNYFDQNRLFGGFVYQFTKESSLQLGYMNIFQQQAAGNKYKSIHTIRLFYFHNFDFRKTAETK
jgi:hypothetical protein